MDSSQLLTLMLTSIGSRLPMLITLGLAVMFVLLMPRSKARRLSLGGLSMLIFTSVVGGLLAILPVLLMAGGNYSGLQGISGMMGILHIGFALIEAVGMALLCWGLVTALRAAAPDKPTAA